MWHALMPHHLILFPNEQSFNQLIFALVDILILGKDLEFSMSDIHKVIIFMLIIYIYFLNIIYGSLNSYFLPLYSLKYI